MTKYTIDWIRHGYSCANMMKEQGFMSNFIISYLTSRPSEVIRSMSDCKLMTKLIAESIVEAMIMSLQRQKGFK